MRLITGSVGLDDLKGVVQAAATGQRRLRRCRRSDRTGPLPPEGASPYAAPHIAELLAGIGRTGEALAVLDQYTPAHRHDLAG